MRVTLPFLDRREELRRIRAALGARTGTLTVLYGRRRCGKSRLLLEAIRRRPSVYYVGDEREGSLQRRSLAKAMAALVPGFERVEYPDWEALLLRFWEEAPSGAVLALDELPYLASASPELAGLLQKRVDAGRKRPLHVVLCGSSQRMMQGLVLDASAPLYGRAREVLKIGPLGFGWLPGAFPCLGRTSLLEAYGIWGGVPRYWELAVPHRSTLAAVRHLVLDPLGVLREEPRRLLLDDLDEVAQASSILALIGEGCHRVSEIAGRIGKPATSLARPLARLVDLGFVERQTPFGTAPRDTKRSLYRLADPFLRFWFRFVEPRRTAIEARQAGLLERDYREFLPSHLGDVWEDLARSSVPRLRIDERRWGPASRFWGPGLDGRPIEIDVVAESVDGSALLVGEAKLRVSARDASRIEGELRAKSRRLPHVSAKEIVPVVFGASRATARARCTSVGLAEVLRALRA